MFVRRDGAGHRFDGHTAAVEDGSVWVVRYSLAVDQRWATRSALVRALEEHRNEKSR